MRPLSPGDEITIAYVELAATRQERREALFEQYNFDIDPPTADDGCVSVVGGSTSSREAGATAAANGDGIGVHSMGGLSLREDAGGPGATGELKGPGGHEASQQQRQPTSLLRPPPLAEQRVDLSASAGCAGPTHSHAAAGVQANQQQLVLRVYGLGVLPPWPRDPKDSALTELRLMHCSNPSTSGNACSSLVGSTFGPGRALPGGVQVHALRAPAPEDAAGSFEGE